LCFGKLLAACSPWPIALAISIPYWQVLAKGDAVFSPAVLWAGVLARCWSGTGRRRTDGEYRVQCDQGSMFVCLGLYLPMLMAAEPFRRAKVVTASEIQKGLVLEIVNPLAGAHGFLAQVLVFDSPLGLVSAMLVPIAVFVVLVFLLLFGYASPRMSLEAGAATKLRSFLATLGVAPAGGSGRRSRHGRPPRRRGNVFTPTAKPRVWRPRPVDASSASSPWWVMFTKEMRDLWIGGRALNLTIAYTVLLGGYAYWMASSSGVSLIPPKEMVFELVKAALLAGVFMGLIVGADSLSGERERATLEGLLLAPTSRRSLVVPSSWPPAPCGRSCCSSPCPYSRCSPKATKSSARQCCGAPCSGSR
jgi:hypothetical protein